MDGEIQKKKLKFEKLIESRLKALTFSTLRGLLKIQIEKTIKKCKRANHCTQNVPMNAETKSPNNIEKDKQINNSSKKLKHETAVRLFCGIKIEAFKSFENLRSLHSFCEP